MQGPGVKFATTAVVTRKANVFCSSQFIPFHIPDALSLFTKALFEAQWFTVVTREYQESC